MSIRAHVIYELIREESGLHMSISCIADDMSNFLIRVDTSSYELRSGSYEKHIPSQVHLNAGPGMYPTIDSWAQTHCGIDSAGALRILHSKTQVVVGCCDLDCWDTYAANVP
jgi:hypothetical protein